MLYQISALGGLKFEKAPCQCSIPAVGAQHLARDPVDSTLLHSSLSASESLLSQPFYPQPASTSFSQFEAQPAQLPPVPNNSLGQVSFLQ